MSKVLNAGPPWAEAVKLRSELEGAGWLSPDTYCRFFETPTNEPAVYLFMLWDDETLGMRDARAFVAYVGQSTKLAQRWTGHPVYAEINGPGVWVQRWFMPTEKPLLRARERELIQRFDPPWNIVGRSRGVRLQ